MGEGIEARQVGPLTVSGSSAFYTGKEEARENWAGGRKGNGSAFKEKGLVGLEVLDSMKRAFLSADYVQIEP